MDFPKITIVTISFNQARFLRQAIDSVLGQKYPNLQYIVVDPGSDDGSREIIRQYRDQIDNVLFEPDEGPADGLNHGFAHAEGEILGYLNADDALLPGALNKIALVFQENPEIDVISGHCQIIDDQGKTLRESYSDTFRRQTVLHRAANLMQPSTFFRKSAFDKTEGFNVENRLDWDTELFVDMHAAGASFMLQNEMLSQYRIYPDTVTAQGRVKLYLADKQKLLFERKYGRRWAWYDHIIRWGCLVLKYASEPRLIRERCLRGRVAGRYQQS